MTRAAVLIGVQRAGNLPELQAVDSALDDMRKWVTSQRIAHVHKFSDASGNRVRAGDIFECISDLCKLGTIEQLVVYFAGHGINKAYGEYWLLTDAPANPNEAVNVRSSVRLARRCGIPHVVFVSDACRTAPEGIRAQSVTGTIIFPNSPPHSPACSVDEFYACLLGDPAYEIRNPAESAEVFEAVYTRVLTEALGGLHGELIERMPNVPLGYVRPWPLKRRLPGLLSARLRERNASITIHQTPDAIVCSDPARDWLAQVIQTDEHLQPPARPLRDKGFHPLPQRTGYARSGITAIPQAAGSPERKSPAPDMLTSLAKEAHEAAKRLAQDFGPTHFETASGFKVRGEIVTNVALADGRADQLSENLVRVVHSSAASATNVLLQFSSGRGTVVPALRDYIASLSFEDGQLVDVTYEPSENTWRWEEYVARRRELRELRATIAASSRFGTFRLDEDEPDAIIDRLRFTTHLDPSLVLYAAYACSALGRHGVIQNMGTRLGSDLGVPLFDITLLADDLNASSGPVYPWFPLISRGWPILAGSRAAETKELGDLQRSLVPSLWTLFDRTGVALLSNQLVQRGVT